MNTNKGNIRKNSFALAVCFVTVVFFVSDNAESQDEIVLSKSLDKKIVVETTHQFYVRTYENEIAFNPRTFAYEKFSLKVSPEIAVANVLSASANRDSSVYESYMSESYKKAYKKGTNIFSSNKNMWSRDSVVRLARRVDIGPDKIIDRNKGVIIVYEVLDQYSNKKVFEGDLQFIYDSGWYLVDLADDVIFQNWDFNGAKIIINVEKIGIDSD